MEGQKINSSNKRNKYLSLANSFVYQQNYIFLYSVNQTQIDLITFYNQSTFSQTIFNKIRKHLKNIFNLQFESLSFQFNRNLQNLLMKSLTVEPNFSTISQRIERKPQVQLDGEQDGLNEKNENSRNTIQQENTLELMIRAHQRIRTLQEDNQILRMHVELLTKDNQQLTRKLQNSSEQKIQIFKKNQELKKEMEELQIKLQGFKVKERLQSFQNAKFNMRAKYDKYEQKNYGKANDSNFPRLQDKENAQNKQEKRLQINHFSNNLEIQKTENKSVDHRSQMEKTFEIEKCQQVEKNFVQLDNKSKLFSQLQNKKNRSEQKSNQHYFTPNKSFNFQNNQNKLSRNLSHKQFCYFESGNKNIGYRNDRNLSGNWSEMSDNHENLANKNIQTSASNFYANKNTELRTNTPMIRKNSPGKNRVNGCEFHPHRKNPSTYGSNYSNEQNLSKKFNYTNWRKSNNSLLMWRLATGSGHHKTICIDR